MAESLCIGCIIVLLLALLFLFKLRRPANEQFRLYDTNKTAVQMYLDSTPKTAERITTGGLTSHALLYTGAEMQGNAVEFKYGKAVQFMEQRANGQRVWQFKSLQFPSANQVLRIIAYCPTTNKRLAVQMVSRYNSIPNLEQFLLEDPTLARPDVLAFSSSNGLHLQFSIGLV